jgi:DNA-binding NtrC family response regulator
MKTNKKAVFVVENNKLERNLIRDFFKGNHKYEFRYFTTSAECFAALKEHPMAVLIDYDLKTINSSENDGIKILDKIKELEHNTEVVFYSHHENTEVAVATIKHGAFDYIVLNEFLFYRLENELQTIQEHIFHQKESGRYRFLFLTTLSIGIFWILLVVVLVILGILKPGDNVWLEP